VSWGCGERGFARRAHTSRTHTHTASSTRHSRDAHATHATGHPVHDTPHATRPCATPRRSPPRCAPHLRLRSLPLPPSTRAPPATRTPRMSALHAVAVARGRHAHARCGASTGVSDARASACAVPKKTGQWSRKRPRGRTRAAAGSEGGGKTGRALQGGRTSRARWWGLLGKNCAGWPALGGLSQACWGLGSERPRSACVAQEGPEAPVVWRQSNCGSCAASSACSGPKAVWASKASRRGLEARGARLGQSGRQRGGGDRARGDELCGERALVGELGRHGRPVPRTHRHTPTDRPSRPHPSTSSAPHTSPRKHHRPTRSPPSSSRPRSCRRRRRRRPRRAWRRRSARRGP
jgi:hypothetical protein